MSLAEDMAAAPDEETPAAAETESDSPAPVPPTPPTVSHSDPIAPTPAILRWNGDGQFYKFQDPRQALASGEYTRASAHELVDLEVQQQERAKGLLGSIAAAGGSAANQALFGVPGAITEETESPEQKERRLAEERYHATARLLGGAVGVGASLLTGGELFKAADLAGQAVRAGILPAEAIAQAGIGARLAARGAELATQGAVLAAPQAFTQAAFGDPQQAAETLLWGVGTGAILGGAGELLSSAGHAITDKLASPETRTWLEEQVTARGAKAIGAERSQLNKLSPQQIQERVNFAFNEGIIQPGMSRTDIAKSIDAAHTKWGLRLDDVLTNLDGFLTKGTGKEDLSHLGLKPTEIADALRAELDKPDLRWPMNSDQKSALDRVIASAEQLPTTRINGREVVTFADAQKFVSALRKKYASSVAKDASGGGLRGLDVVTPLDHVKADAYLVAKQVMHSAGDRVAQAAAETSPQGRGLIGGLAEAKRAYMNLSELEKWAGTVQRQAAGNRLISLTDFFHMGNGLASGALQTVGAGLGGAVGGPTGAMIGSAAAKVPGALLDLFTKHWAQDKGLVYLAATLRKAAKEGPDAFAAVLGAESRARLTATLSTIGTTVRRMATEGLQSVEPRGQKHLSALLGSTVGRTPDQSFEAAGDRLAELQASPGALAQLTSSMAGPIEQTAPQVALAYQQKMQQAVAYLHATYPRPSTPPPPFAPQVFNASASDKLAWHDRAEIVANPMAAMRHMAQGTLSPSHLEALSTVYPTVYALMKQEVLKFHAEHPHVLLPMSERRSIARFLGVSLGTSDDVAGLLQQTYSQAPAEGAPSTRGKRAAMTKMPSHATTYGATEGPSES